MNKSTFVSPAKRRLREQMAKSDAQKRPRKLTPVRHRDQSNNRNFPDEPFAAKRACLPEIPSIDTKNTKWKDSKLLSRNRNEEKRNILNKSR